MSVIAVSVLAGCGGGGTTPAPPSALPTASALTQELETIRAQYGLPAIVAVGARHDTQVFAATGLRKIDAAGTATVADRWHLGSCTKAMTATLLASAVEEKKLSWTTRPTDVFPSLAASIRPEFRTITLRQLLQHRAGIPAYVTAESLSVVPPLQGTPRDQRRAFALWQLTQAPAAVPGMYLYSNGGYAIAAAMAEETLGAAYETLLGQRLFTPLGITAGFGWPAKDDPNQPWGHTSASGHYVPQDPTDPLQQLPPMGSPAGDVNMSISDYTKFIQMHLGGLRGQDGLLPAQAIQEMHTPTGDYAMGWQVIKPTLGYPVSLHTGSAGSFSCFVRIDPHADLALAVITNAAGESADMAIADIATWLVGQMQR